MRYTTIIDIRENRAIYRNQNARLIYLHMVLASGYHDTDRDITDISLRALAEQTGITLSATRHALTQLERAGLLERMSDRKYHVKKWILDEPPTPRPRKAQSATVKSEGQIGKRWESEIADYRQKVLGAIRASSRDELGVAPGAGGRPQEEPPRRIYIAEHCEYRVDAEDSGYRSVNEDQKNNRRYPHGRRRSNGVKK